MDDLGIYIQRLQKLRVDRSKGIAPHKPILLLSILQLFKNGFQSENKIFITPELISLFKENWAILVTTDHDCKFALPFYHLTGDGFWNLVPKKGFENIITIKGTMRSINNLVDAVEYGCFKDEFYKFCLDPKSNFILEKFILDFYFPTKARSYNAPFEKSDYEIKIIENKIVNEDKEEYRKEIKKLLEQKNEEEIVIRGMIFKREIPKNYNFSCCISGMKISSTFNVSMVDACHIVPFSKSFDDTIKNGISLCPNLHRAFDRGLISINEDFKVLVSDRFIENESNYALKNFKNQIIELPKIDHLFPDKNNLKWHKENIFLN